MKFDVYYPFYSKKAGKLVPGIEPNPMEWAAIKRDILGSQDVKDKIERHRQGDPDAKISLPSICFVGTSVSTRKNAAMIPTQYVMIDIDHCPDALGAWEQIKQTMTWEWICDNVVVAHLTPSKGIHIYFKAQEGLETLKDNMDWLNEQVDFSRFGVYDGVVHDFARISFAFRADEILFESASLYLEVAPEMAQILTNPAFDPDEQEPKNKQKNEKTKTDNDIPEFTDEEKAKMDADRYKQTPLKEIIEAWVDYRGEPGDNEVHNYYNEMVKYFRNIMGNNKRKLFYLLPRFGHSAEECWSQVKSITKSNTLSRLDREFYFFLLDRGYITARKDQQEVDYMMAEDDEKDDFGDMPTPPPVIREFVRMAPKDFRIPLINALQPILGTLSSYVQARYPYDDRMHTTSFFSIIYAPPSFGKGFVDRLDFLFDDLRLRDLVQNAREKIYLKAINRKGDNERAPEDPHTSLRIIPPKNSEAEFLEKQRDNHGYHMYTFAAEMDSWAKGEKAAGGNKSDMIRIAWDNGEYGQQFKSSATFKGKVRLYWNVLITGTLSQIENYFRNVENGLASRCSFCELENQEYQLAQLWKPMPQKGMDIVRNYMKRCDENSYEEPCTVTQQEVECVADEDFDKEVNWRFKFRERQTVDMSWIIPTIDEFEREQCTKAALALDPARDSFRRRVGVRGFRLALLCTTLYPTMTSRARTTIIQFVKWWMRVDLENILKLFGEKYNEQNKKVPGFVNHDVFAELQATFNKNDVVGAMRKLNRKNRVNDVVYRWKKIGAIEETKEKGVYKKKER